MYDETGGVGGIPSCQCPTNAILLDGTCFLCTSLRTKNSTGFVNVSAPSDSPACTCSKSFVFNPTSKVC